MNPTRHNILDVETLDIQPSAIILTIGIATVEISDGGLDILGRHYWRVLPFEQPGRTVSEETLEWWRSQPSPALNEALNTSDHHREPLPQILSAVSATLDLYPHPIWGNGSDFDNAIMKHAFRQLGLNWPPYRDRCLRTARQIAKSVVPDFHTPERPAHLTPHIALDDAEYEALQLAHYMFAIDGNRPYPMNTLPRSNQPFDGAAVL
ncbi:3'-5' exonuclease [Chromobacterium violaceum]|uniref:3'-5' exonuclease n=1 Tax=Chromobacterium violaceum TaxID=536 RepID=UPI0015FC66DD|nr:3'-5' exonuclease [Chromobacterium violaceum]MBA8734206.1 3'-5' exoribonuclease [Chromobacterium violaceum]